MKECHEANKQHDHAHMAEMAMMVDPLAPVASTSALPAPPPIPTSLPIVTTVNGNDRIVTAPTFILKALLAAIAAKPIPCKYTGSKEVQLSYNQDSFASVQFLNHELNAKYIEQGSFQQDSIAVPAFFGSHKNIFHCSVNTGL